MPTSPKAQLFPITSSRDTIYWTSQLQKNNSFFPRYVFGAKITNDILPQNVVVINADNSSNKKYL